MDLGSRRVRYQALFAVYFLAYSGIVVYRNVFLEDIGMTGTQMGVIGFTFVIVGVVAQPGWGLLTDWRGVHSEILIAGALGSAFGLSVYLVGAETAETFLVVLAGTVVFSLFHAPIVPLANSLVLSEGFEYGRIRAFGSVSFGIGSMAIGLLLALVETWFIVVAYAVGMVVIADLIRRTPIARPSVSDRLRGKVRTLVIDREFALLVLVALLLAMSTSSASAFFSVYMRAITGGDTLTGVAWTLKTVFEAVTFLYLVRYELPYRVILLVGGSFAAVPSLLYGLTSSLWIVLAVQAFAGLGYAMYYLATVNLAHRLAPDELSSTAQTVVASLGLGVGGAIGQLLAGRVLDAAGIHRLYLALGVVALVGVFVALFLSNEHDTGAPGAG